MVTSYNKNLIHSICTQIIGDQYSEVNQKESKNRAPFHPFTVDFVTRNMRTERFLEIGCGYGQSFDYFPITDAVEPCSQRREVSRQKKISVTAGFSEYLPYESNMFDTVLMLDTFDQVRSVVETVAEINRVLKLGGVFIFDCQVDDGVDIVYGLVYGFKNLRRFIEDFGFKGIETRTIQGRGLYCMEKCYDWTPKMLSKLQLVKNGENWIAKNFHPEKKFHQYLL